MAALLDAAGYEIVAEDPSTPGAGAPPPSEEGGYNSTMQSAPMPPSVEGGARRAGVAIALVNTCAFIDDAKRESIDTILELIEEKERGEIDKIIVSGCLAERYKDEILHEFPEIDAALGVHSCNDITEAVRWFTVGVAPQGDPLKKSAPNPVGAVDPDRPRATESVAPTDETNTSHFSSFRTPENACPDGERLLSTPPYTAYLKISEGCDNRCTYCIIPHIRGPHRSRRVDEIVAEAWSLEARGVKEICLVAQDLTAYDGKWQSHPAPPGHPSMEGKKTDSAAPLPLCGGVAAKPTGWPGLPVLLTALLTHTTIPWIRLLYCYPERITPELIAIIRDNPRIVRYIDMPIQHIADPVLRRMKRRGDSATIRSAMAQLRREVPNIAIRSTLIVGFPGETEEDFAELHQFVLDGNFDRLGVFAYSAEEGTPAAEMPDQIDPEVARRRVDIIMSSQREVSLAKNQAKIGTTVQVLVESANSGRTQADAPEIDCLVYIEKEGGTNLCLPGSGGEFVNVRIDRCDEYDLYGVVDNTHNPM